MSHALSRRISDVLALDPAASAIQFQGQWFTWGQVGAIAARIAALVTERGGAQTRVGIMLRNQPVHVAALLGVLAGGGTVVVINPPAGTNAPGRIFLAWTFRWSSACPTTSPACMC